jgi:hypothetical protein
LSQAYAELSVPDDEAGDPFAAAERQFMSLHSTVIPEKVREIAVRVKEADDAATDARLTAERMFDEAERKLSAGMAKKAALQAIAAYELRYKAIAEAEAAARR